MNENYPVPFFYDDKKQLIRDSIKIPTVLPKFSSEVLKNTRALKAVINSMSSAMAIYQETALTKQMKDITTIISSINRINSLKVIESMSVISSLNSVNLKKTFESLNIPLQSIYKMNNELSRIEPTPENNQLSEILSEIQNPPTTPVQDDNTKQLITEVQKRLYNLSHNIIAPFKDRSELAKWISFYILQEVLSSPQIPIQLKMILIIGITYHLSSNTLQ